MSKGGVSRPRGEELTSQLTDRDGKQQRRVQTRRRPAEVRQRLLEAAERVVIQKGLAVTAQDVASESRIHRTVLRRHFPDTSGLIREAALRPFREFLAVFQSRVQRERPGTAQPTWDLTRDLIAELTANFSEHRGFMTRVLADPSVLGDANWAALHQTLDALIDEMAALSEEQGKMRGLDTESMPIKTRLTIAMIAGITTHGDWLLPRGERALSREQLADAICDFVLYGVRLVPEDAKELDRAPPGDQA